MTDRGRTIAERLPLLYRDGELVNALLSPVGLQHEIVDENARRVQRRHWFDTAPGLDDAAKLGDLLDIGPEPWQALGEYRAWFHALRTARLRRGAVTGEALRGFVEDYTEAFEAADDIDVLPPFDDWSDEPTAVGHAFVENPALRRDAVLAGPAGVTPLHRQVVVNGGLDPTPLQLLATGTAGGPEYVPVVVNLRTGVALVHLGPIAPGERLWIRVDGGTVTAELEGRDVSDELRTIVQVRPGAPWELAQVSTPASALVLAPGENELWFLPVAHFDEPGLDRVLLALADLDLRQGRWDETAFDRSLFAQDAALVVQLRWDEASPATVLVDLDGGSMLSPAARLDDALENRAQLVGSLQSGVSSLAAAGVRADVRVRPLVASQRQRDRLRMILPVRQREVGTVGIDHLPDAGGVFGVTDFNDSTYR